MGAALKGNLSSRQSRVAQMLTLQEQASASCLSRLHPFLFVARTPPMRATAVPVTSVDQTQSTGNSPKNGRAADFTYSHVTPLRQQQPCRFWAASSPLNLMCNVPESSS